MGNDSCAETYARNVSSLDMLTVWQAVAGICKDPLDICTYHETNKTYGFKDNKEIPANYICIGYERFNKSVEDITSIGRT